MIDTCIYSKWTIKEEEEDDDELNLERKEHWLFVLLTIYFVKKQYQIKLTYSSVRNF